MDKKITTSIAFSQGLWEEMRLRAFEDKISLGELVRRAVVKYLAKGKPKKKGPRK